MGILQKHADDNYYTRTFDNFVERLERGELPTKALLWFDLYGSECADCEQKVTAFKYRGDRYHLHLTGPKDARRWIVHQCPPYEGEIYPDDPEVRDGDGRIVGGGWTDPGPEPDPFNDDPYNYPDIPYVDPTR